MTPCVPESFQSLAGGPGPGVVPGEDRVVVKIGPIDNDAFAIDKRAHIFCPHQPAHTNMHS
jgi:hypothetical protein